MKTVLKRNALSYFQICLEIDVNQAEVIRQKQEINLQRRRALK
jgi:hypothetical protein